MMGDNVCLLPSVGLERCPSSVIVTSTIKGGRKVVFLICDWSQVAHKAPVSARWKTNTRI